MTCKPCSLKNLAPMGDTWIGRKGKKYRSALAGQKRATPFPPLVKASRRVCEVVLIQTSVKTIAGLDRSFLENKTEIVAQARAATKECEAPRWPHADP
jgi:hypothetical protein